MRRRSFLTAATLSAAGLASPTQLPAQSAPATKSGPRNIPRYPQDAWLDALPGAHRLFLDAVDAESAAGALGFGWNFLKTSQTGYRLKDEDQAVVICLRHSATVFAFSNDLWRTHDALRTMKYRHPETEKQVKGGNVFRLGSTRPASMEEGFTFDGLARRGVHFALCGVAARGLAGMMAGKGASADAVETAMDALHAGAVANAHFMASGILAAQRAGEYGYTVIGG